MTAILQISDTHIVPGGALVSAQLDTSEALARLVTRIGTIRDQIGPIDAVLVSGDLSDDGSADSYARIKSILLPLNLPLHVIPGNHDARASMRAAFADQMPEDGPLNWDLKVGDIHMIGLDTLVEGHRHGALIPATLTYLRDALKRAGGSPILLALHHPPFASGIRFMDAIGLINQDAIKDAVARHPSEIRIVCGHIHNMMVHCVAGHIAISAPSPNSTFAYDRRAEAPVGFMTQEDGCLLHRWEAGFQTIRIGPVAGSGPFPF